jgi:hypothetical protein
MCHFRFVRQNTGFYDMEPGSRPGSRVQPAEVWVTRRRVVNRGEDVEAVEVAVGVDAGLHPPFHLKGCCQHHASIEMQ